MEKSKGIMRKISLGKAICTHPNGRMPFSDQTFQRVTCFKGGHSESFEMCSLELNDTAEDRCQIMPAMIKQWPRFNSKMV